MRSWMWLVVGLACAPLRAAPDPLADPQLPGIDHGDPALERVLAEALASQGPDYEPRTHHRDGSKPHFTNRLILETSPYLLQHAHNPVNWFPWGDAAFARAEALDRPVLLSVGYSTCHWCHVMERESFEDLEIAAYINEHFVAIKVDREERPDVDDVYMTAVNLLTGRGGWPMTVILTPERQPFFGGTYFPARDGDRGRSKGFLTILNELSTLYAHDRQAAVSQAAQISARMARSSSTPPPSSRVPRPDALVNAAEGFARRFDPEWGGFSNRPKFPRPSSLVFLMRYHRRSGDPHALHMVVKTLERMDAGGIHDHVGGGFHRYSVDRIWHEPHYEKMLYDNAQLAMTYSEAAQLTGREDFEAIAAEILEYLLREMVTPEGVFYSATDADSPGPDGESEEGLFFEWSWAELVEVLGEEGADQWGRAFGVTRAAAKTTLMRKAPRSAVAATEGLRQKLYAARLLRAPPLRDDKVIVAWNGLAISALARVGMAQGNPRFVLAADRAARRVLDKARVDGRLHRTLRDGVARNPAVLDDMAFLIRGLLDTFEATGSVDLLDAAIELQTELDARFQDAGGGYYLTPEGGEVLLNRPMPEYDGAEPSGNSVTALNLLRLGSLTGDDAWDERARKLLGRFGGLLAERGVSAPLMEAALDYHHDRALELLFVSPPGGDPAALRAEVARRFLPNRVIVAVEEAQVDDLARTLTVLEGKVARDGAPTAYVCERGACKEPTTDPAALGRLLDEVTPIFEDRSAPLLFTTPASPGSRTGR